MIIKNGEILAIDHIAHDNTLSGNGTSAKPVGLSQSTKNLIESKVKQTDFDAYKSSVANQIRDINNTITADESSLESYKETVAANFTAVNDRITNVANAKQDKGNYVSATNFNDFKNTVEGQIEALETGKQPVGDYVVTNDFNSYKETVDGKFTTVNERITNVDNAKQDKGEYVSASDFNTYKTNVAGEITRVDGRINDTNTNLANNYYDRTTIDKKFADFGGYKFRDADPDNNNQPILNDGEEADPKAIYLTQPAQETQYLQWVCEEEHIDPPVWKCIGDTTMDLKDYAKTVDVVASANANKQEIETWANNKFETSADFNTVIANYYTKGTVDTKLAAKADKTEVDQDFVDTSAWANATFATKTALAEDKAELEGKINDLDTKVETELSAVSGKIIGELNSSEQALDERIDGIIVDLGNVSSTLEDGITEVDNKVDTLTDELHDDYYTSEQIDARLAASGEYYTQDQVDEKLKEYAKSTDLDPIKDDINSISAEFDNYYTKTDADEKFVTKTSFNVLDEFVNAIDDDLDTVSADVDTLSGKVNKLHNTVIESSNTVIATPTTGEDGTVIYELSANGNELWKPTVNADGDISWERSESTIAPTTVNIKGPKGNDGKTPEFRINSETNYWEYKFDNTDWISLDISATGPQGPAGTNGTNGQNGADGISLSATSQELTNKTQVQIGQVNGLVQTTFDLPWGQDGISPTVTTNILPPDEHQAEGHINGGVKVTITDKTGDHEYTAWNGNDGTMAGAPNIEGKNGISAILAGSTYEVGLSGEFYKAVTSVSSKLDASVAASTYATKDALDDYLTKNDAAEAYQPKGEYLSANALNGYATQSWVENKHYLTEIPSEYITETELAGYNYATTGLVDEASANAYDAATADANSKYVATADLLTAASNKLTGIKVGNTDYTIQETDWTNTIQDASAKAFNDATANANNLYVTKTSAATEFTNTSSWANTTFQPKGNYVATADLLTAAGNTLTGIKVGDINYEIPDTGITEVKHDTSLTGNGNANNLGVAWSALSGNTIASANKAGEAQGFRWGDNSYQDTSAALTNLWNAKNHVTLQTADNILTVDNNDNTSATLSAMSYVNNNSHAGWLPQKSCVCLEGEIFGMSELADGQGMLFFVVSAH